MSSRKPKPSKGKTLDLAQFLGGGSGLSAAPVMDWAQEMEQEDKQVSKVKNEIIQARSQLPSAPRAARTQPGDDDRIPQEPPFILRISNVPFEADRNLVQMWFDDQNFQVELDLAQEGSKLRGFGEVTFANRNDCIACLNYSNPVIKSRVVRFEMPSQQNSYSNKRSERGRGSSNAQYPSYDEYDRSGPSSQAGANSWRDTRGSQRQTSYGGRGQQQYDQRERGQMRQDGPEYDSRYSGGSNTLPRRQPAKPNYQEPRSSYDGPSYPPSNYPDGGGSYGYDQRYMNQQAPYPPPYSMQVNYGPPQNQSYQSDFRGGYGPRDGYGPSNRGYNRGQPATQDFRQHGGRQQRQFPDHPRPPPLPQEAPEAAPQKERPKLQLLPRTKPVAAEPEVAVADAECRPSVFGGAKPVDTAAKEREIEERLAREKEALERRVSADQQRHDSAPRETISRQSERTISTSSSVYAYGGRRHSDYKSSEVNTTTNSARAPLRSQQSDAGCRNEGGGIHILTRSQSSVSASQNNDTINASAAAVPLSLQQPEPHQNSPERSGRDPQQQQRRITESEVHDGAEAQRSVVADDHRLHHTDSTDNAFESDNRGGEDQKANASGEDTAPSSDRRGSGKYTGRVVYNSSNKPSATRGNERFGNRGGHQAFRGMPRKFSAEYSSDNDRRQQYQRLEADEKYNRRGSTDSKQDYTRTHNARGENQGNLAYGRSSVPRENGMQYDERAKLAREKENSGSSENVSQTRRGSNPNMMRSSAANNRSNDEAQKASRGAKPNVQIQAQKPPRHQAASRELPQFQESTGPTFQDKNKFMMLGESAD